MREPDFHSLRETLLRGGVAPTHIRRTITELQDHHTDLFAEAFAKGCSVENAALEASIRLGDEDALAAEILARPELRSWTHRWPWVAYCVTPTVLFVLAFVPLLLLLVLSGAVQLDRGAFSNRWGSPDSIWSVAGAIRAFYTFGLPLLLAASCCVVAGRRRTAMRWPVFGVIIVSIIGGAIQFDVIWPYGPELHGALQMRTAVPPFPGFTGTLLRAAATCALTLGPYLLWRRRVGGPVRHSEFGADCQCKNAEAVSADEVCPSQSFS